MARRRWRWRAAWSLAIALGAPAIAEAQLFPNLPTHKRGRVACDHEAPVFQLYRQDYYGYHPTCWHPFPAGWGCHSPYAANTAETRMQIQRELERIRQSPENQPQPVPGEEDMNTMPGEGDTAPPPNLNNPDLPTVPENQRSPFETDPGMGSGLPQGGREVPDQQPAGTPVAPPAGTAPTTPRGRTPRGSSAPDLNAPRGAGAAESPLDRLEAPEAVAPPVALLDVGNPSSPPAEAANPEALPQPAMPEPSAPGLTPAPLPSPAVQAPQRRGPLSGLFQGLTRRKR